MLQKVLDIINHQNILRIKNYFIHIQMEGPDQFFASVYKILEFLLFALIIILLEKVKSAV